MKIIMMGTGPFAVPTFEALLSDGHEIPLLVTRPPVQSKGKQPPTEPDAGGGSVPRNSRL
jgi:methionyl-tRNA formyltransferase